MAARSTAPTPRPHLRYEVVAEGLNLRSGPGIEAPPLAVLTRGTRVTRLGNDASARWLNVRAGRREGWVSAKYLQALPATPRRSTFPWLTIARGELGVHEVAGAASNPRIVEYLRSTTLPRQYADTDETPWCSAFVNWCIERSGFAGTDSAAARSWLTWGAAIERPRVGCIVVFRRGQDGGHVGFFLDEDDRRVLLLGGNQSNRVCEQHYLKANWLGYRAPG